MYARLHRRRRHNGGPGASVDTMHNILRSTLLAHAHAGGEGVRKVEHKGEQQQRSLRPGFSRGDGRGRLRYPDSCK